MSIRASVNQVDSFSNSIDELQNSFDAGVQSMLSVCDTVEQSINNFLSGIDSILSQIDSDISNAEYWRYKNESLYAKFEAEKEFSEKRLAAVQDEADIKRYQKSIENCDFKMNQISQKNAKLSAIVSRLNSFKNKYIELKRKLPNADTIKKIRKNLEQLKSEHWSFCSKYTQKAFSAQKLIAEIDENLSYVAEISSSNSRVVTLHNANSLTDMAHSLRAVSDSISEQNGGFVNEVSTFSSVLQDEVTNNAVALCEESVRNVERLVDNFEDLARHFEVAARYLREYENLV